MVASPEQYSVHYKLLGFFHALSPDITNVPIVVVLSEPVPENKEFILRSEVTMAVLKNSFFDTIFHFNQSSISSINSSMVP